MYTEIIDNGEKKERIFAQIDTGWRRRDDRNVAFQFSLQMTKEILGFDPKLFNVINLFCLLSFCGS